MPWKRDSTEFRFRPITFTSSLNSWNGATNHRTDEYGGSTVNREPILFEIIDKVLDHVSGVADYTLYCLPTSPPCNSTEVAVPASRSSISSSLIAVRAAGTLQPRPGNWVSNKLPKDGLEVRFTVDQNNNITEIRSS